MTHTDQLRRALRAYDLAGPETPERANALAAVLSAAHRVCDSTGQRVSDTHESYVLANKKALGTVLQALVNAPHYIRELQATREPVALFGDNPINVLIANYEAPHESAE